MRSDTMQPKIDIIKASSLTTSTWSGGTTTQIAISPLDGDYAAREFDWRISTATVEVSESSFTPLQGVTRFITSLSGELKLIHQGHHSVTLKPFEVDKFEGDWSTTSYGQVTDFNLMIKRGYEGDLRSEKIQQGLSSALSFKSYSDDSFERIFGVYAADGSLQCLVNDSITYSLDQGDLLLSSLPPGCDLTLAAESARDMTVCIIELRKL